MQITKIIAKTVLYEGLTLENFDNPCQGRP